MFRDILLKERCFVHPPENTTVVVQTNGSYVLYFSDCALQDIGQGEALNCPQTGKLTFNCAHLFNILRKQWQLHGLGAASASK